MKTSYVATLALVGALALAGCSDKGSTAEPDEPTGSSPTATGTPTGPVAPELPSAAKVATPEGAVAFVEYFLTVADYATDTGDIDTLRALSTKRCDACTEVADGLQRIYNDGGQISAADTVVKDIAVDGTYSEDPLDIRLSFTAIAPRTSVTYGPKDDRNGTRPRATVHLLTRCLWTSDGWRVIAMGGQ